MPLDLLLTNATILTMDEDRPVAGAVAIEGDRIAWVGAIEDARAHLTGVRRELDLDGATVVPGFNDAHNHLILLGHWLSQLDCSFPTVTSIADIVAAVAARGGHAGRRVDRGARVRRQQTGRASPYFALGS